MNSNKLRNYELGRVCTSISHSIHFPVCLFFTPFESCQWVLSVLLSFFTFFPLISLTDFALPSAFSGSALHCSHILCDSAEQHDCDSSEQVSGKCLQTALRSCDIHHHDAKIVFQLRESYQELPRYIGENSIRWFLRRRCFKSGNSN